MAPQSRSLLLAIAALLLPSLSLLLTGCQEADDNTNGDTETSATPAPTPSLRTTAPAETPAPSPEPPSAASTATPAPTTAEPTTAPTTEPATATPERVHPKEWEHFTLINSRRRQGYTCPDGETYPGNSEDLVFDCRLWRAARLHTVDMGTTGKLSHTGSDGSKFWERAQDQGIGANGENIAYGSSSAESTLNQFLGSQSGHCNNLMNPRFTMAAVGYFDSSPPGWYHWWTEIFKITPVAADTSCYPEDAAPAPSGRAAVGPTSTQAAVGEPCTDHMASCP